jgi:subfamily B ATP-binding cassette protein MsbA
MARLGGIGAGLTLPRGDRRGGRAARIAGGDEKKRKAPPFKVILRDAAELVHKRRGRLAIGFGLLAINRICGLVLPGTTKFLLDEVIGKGRRELLVVLVLAAGGATLVQAVTSFALSQILGRAAQRSITEMRRRVQRHVSTLPVAFFDQTKTGALLSRVMTDAEGIRNLVGTGLVEVAGGLLTAALALGLLF